jgi:hypothetical protein
MTRLDSFNHFNHPYMARGQFMFRGLAVVISPNVPREHIGHELIPVPRWFLYRAVYWLLAGARIEREQYFTMGGKTFMTEQG